MDRLRALLTLAWPIVLARATQSVIGFGDAVMTAPLGEAELAAVTTGGINTYAFIILPMGAAFILQSFASQLRGRGDLSAIPRYMYYGLAMALAAGVFALIATPAIPFLLSLVGYDPEVESFMATYIMIRMLSVAPAVGMEAIGNWYGGLGNTRPSLIASIVAMVLDLFFNYALIEPRFGLPGYGVAGAAWGSTVSTWVGFFVLYGMFALRKGMPVELTFESKLNLRWSELWRVLRFGLPSGVNWFLEFAAFALFLNMVVGHLGTTALAAFMVVLQVNSISFMPAFGLASAGAIMVGEAIGRGQHDEAASWVKLTFQVAATWMCSVGVFYFAIPHLIVGWFDQDGHNSAELVRLATLMLGLSAIWQLFDAAGMTVSEALRAAGDTAWCMAARLVLAWLVFTPASWVAVRVFDGGVNTVMFAFMAYMALLAAVFVWRFVSNRWRSIDLVGEPVVV